MLVGAGRGQNVGLRRGQTTRAGPFLRSAAGGARCRLVGSELHDNFWRWCSSLRVCANRIHCSTLRTPRAHPTVLVQALFLRHTPTTLKCLGQLLRPPRPCSAPMQRGSHKHLHRLEFCCQSSQGVRNDDVRCQRIVSNSILKRLNCCRNLCRSVCTLS